MSRKNVSIAKPVEERADAIIRERGFAGLSDLIATLVREEFERKGLTLQETPPPYGVSSGPEVPASPATQEANNQKLLELVKHLAPKPKKTRKGTQAPK